MAGEDDAVGWLGMLAWFNFDEFVIGMGLVVVALIVRAGCGGPAMAALAVAAAAMLLQCCYCCFAYSFTCCNAAMLQCCSLLLSAAPVLVKPLPSSFS